MKEKSLQVKQGLLESIKGIMKSIAKSIFKYEDLNEEEKEERMRKKLIHDAHRQWMEKEEYFRCVSDSDLVDFAIYDMEASKRKYMYLLNNFKKETNV